jgi:hypothetical protein
MSEIEIDRILIAPVNNAMWHETGSSLDRGAGGGPLAAIEAPTRPWPG